MSPSRTGRQTREGASCDRSHQVEKGIRSALNVTTETLVKPSAAHEQYPVPNPAKNGARYRQGFTRHLKITVCLAGHLPIGILRSVHFRRNHWVSPQPSQPSG